MDKDEKDLTYGDWLHQIKDFGGGWLGLVVIVIIVLATAVGAWFGLTLFPDGEYPRIVLALPGLACGGVAFFASSSFLWRFKKKPDSPFPPSATSLSAVVKPPLEQPERSSALAESVPLRTIESQHLSSVPIPVPASPLVNNAPHLETIGAACIGGIGTVFCGERDYRPDGTYVTTKWAVLFCVPILPFRSLRTGNVASDSTNFVIARQHSERCEVSEAVPLSWRQILCVYGYVAFMVFWAVRILSFYSWLAQRFGPTTAVVVASVSMGCGGAIPILLRILAKRRAHFPSGNSLLD